MGGILLGRDLAKGQTSGQKQTYYENRMEEGEPLSEEEKAEYEAVKKENAEKKKGAGESAVSE